MRIGRKLAVTHGLMSLLLVGIVFGAKLTIDRIDHDFDVLHHEFSSITEELNNLRAASLGIVSSTNEFAFLATITSEIVDDGISTSAEAEELKDRIEAFNRTFANYSHATEEISKIEVLNRDAIGTAGSALITESRRLADGVETGTGHLELLDNKDRMEGLERSFLAMIARTNIAAHETFEERLQAEASLNELNENQKALIAARTETTRQNETALVEEKERAETASQARSAFLANMSHEQRTPLNAIIGYSEMMLEDAEDEGAQERASDLQKVQRSGRHLLGLINDILDISKIEAGKVELNFEPVDLAGMIAEVETTAVPLMEKNGNRLKIAIPENLGFIECDDQRLPQILLNLLSNAAKFTDQGAIGLLVERKGDGWVRFAVRDSGIGMSAEQVAQIFEPFGQADSTISQRYGGTGLGLAISQRFVEMLGGRLTIDSELGAGSCFTVWIPDIEIANQDSINSGPRILIIEDSPSDISLLERYLRPSGFQIEVARDSEQGLALARMNRPSVILLDLELPGINGFGVLDALHAETELAAIPVILTSVHNEREQALNLGTLGFVTKPIDRHVLQAALSANLPRRKRNKNSPNSPAPARTATG